MAVLVGFQVPSGDIDLCRAAIEGLADGAPAPDPTGEPLIGKPGALLIGREQTSGRGTITAVTALGDGTVEVTLRVESDEWDRSPTWRDVRKTLKAREAPLPGRMAFIPTVWATGTQTVVTAAGVLHLTWCPDYVPPAPPPPGTDP